MATKLYVGNLSYSTTTASLKAAFEKAGEVTDAIVMEDRDQPGRSRGFGFVTMANEDGAKAAIDMYNEKDLDGRNIRVNEARPMEPRAPRAPRSEGRGNW